jgi:hypothetical protein
VSCNFFSCGFSSVSNANCEGSSGNKRCMCKPGWIASDGKCCEDSLHACCNGVCP